MQAGVSLPINSSLNRSCAPGMLKFLEMQETAHRENHGKKSLWRQGNDTVYWQNRAHTRVILSGRQRNVLPHLRAKCGFSPRGRTEKTAVSLGEVRGGFKDKLAPQKIRSCALIDGRSGRSFLHLTLN